MYHDLPEFNFEIASTQGGRPIKEQFLTATEWIKSKIYDIENRIYKPKGELCTIGKVKEIVMDFLNNEKIKLESPVIALEDKGLRHTLCDIKPHKIPMDIWKEMPILLEKAEGIYFNIREQALVYEIKKGNLIAKVVVQLNYSTKVKIQTGEGMKRETKIINNLRTGAIINDNREFMNKGMYKKIK